MEVVDESGFQVVTFPGQKGKGLVATADFLEGSTIFEEDPIVCCQFPWNATCKYRACDYCMRALETAEENIRRLLNNPDIIIPNHECCTTDKSSHTECDLCGTEYCSQECLQRAMAEYHQVLCMRTKSRDGSHPIEIINETWKNFYYPPESGSIMIFAKIFALINQAADKSKILHKFSQFCQFTSNEDEEITHKLLGDNFRHHIDVLREMFVSAFGIPECQHWMTPEGFSSLIALVGTNGQGVGSSALAEWAKRAGDLDLPRAEKEQLEEFIDNLYSNLDDESGGFLNCEGSALYELQSKINHSCDPNAEVCFLNGNSRITVRALKEIHQGDEITISYLSMCDVDRSRHSRQKELRANYLFQCQCTKCQTQAEDPDVTSDEEFSSGDDDN
ncbi:histone-lysine N-trimethyltransferase SMYD5 [Cloeon dipterum]|uniref:histone-lysine N-trimethyltransferase SMYD5 n=1 Tax=Cloeon dipterum TaxID=197152 RepID=UPI00321FB9E5